MGSSPTFTTAPYRLAVDASSDTTWRLVTISSTDPAGQEYIDREVALIRREQLEDETLGDDFDLIMRWQKRECYAGHFHDLRTAIEAAIFLDSASGKVADAP